MACQHERLYFGSGDYYIRCFGCDGVWARMSATGSQKEYGIDKHGQKIGADPSACHPEYMHDPRELVRTSQ